MKTVIQRVTHASVTVNNKTIGKIEKGFLILFGAGQGDTDKDAQKLADKIMGLRIFPDDNDKINLSLKDVDGEVLIVSQFTLYADCKKGNRPSFVKSCEPNEANRLYEYFVNLFRGKVKNVQTGEFGADMKVELLNDGPFTIIIECNGGVISSC
ncbi:MAG: D-aminoacyl-tRNA deacylase [Oscillospiraceae bacterium]